MKLRLPGPTIAIIVVAIVVSSAGSAVGAKLITGKEIRNGTITAADIKKGSIYSNRLSKGTQRLLRSKSGSSPSSGGGPVAYEAIRKVGPSGLAPGSFHRVASVEVPAGAYLVQANTVMTAHAGETSPLEALIGANGSLGGTCTLNAAGPAHSSTGTIIVNDRQTPTTMSMQLTRTVGETSTFFLECAASAPFTLTETSIIATTLSNIVLTESTG